MTWLWERFGRLGGAVWKWYGGRWLGLVCAAALGASGCGYTAPPDCLDPEAPDGCEHPVDEPPANTLVCDLYPVEGSDTGTCVPYVDAGWHTMLARMAHLPKSQLRCPESAPNAGLSGVEIPDEPVQPRRVIGCSVNPLSTCPSPGLACVPFELDYPACVTQSGLHDCPAEYPHRTAVEEDGIGADVTVCCRPPDKAS